MTIGASVIAAQLAIAIFLLVMYIWNRRSILERYNFCRQQLDLFVSIKLGVDFKACLLHSARAGLKKLVTVFRTTRVLDTNYYKSWEWGRRPLRDFLKLFLFLKILFPCSLCQLDRMFGSSIVFR